MFLPSSEPTTTPPPPAPDEADYEAATSSHDESCQHEDHHDDDRRSILSRLRQTSVPLGPIAPRSRCAPSFFEYLRLDAHPLPAAGDNSSPSQPDYSSSSTAASLTEDNTNPNDVQQMLLLLLFARYKWTGEWLPCVLRSYDIDGTCTVVWQTGHLQIGTRTRDMVACTSALTSRIVRHEQWGDKLPLPLLQTRDSPTLFSRLLDRLPYRWLRSFFFAETTEDDPAAERDLGSNSAFATVTSSLDDDATEPPLPQPPQPFLYKGMDVWEASKQGNMEVTLAIIDQGHATPNDVEQLTVVVTSSSSSVQDDSNQTTATHGRTPLYWACFGGHVDLVRELLARGGVDADGAAYLSVTTRERADDQRDLLFDPDTNTFSDFVDYPGNNNDNNHATLELSSQVYNSSPSEYDAVLIRAMLLAATATNDTRSKSILRRLPKQLYQSTNHNMTEAAAAAATTTTTTGTTTNAVQSNAADLQTSQETTEAQPRDDPTKLSSDNQDSNSNQTDCVICLEQQANAIPVPCGHIACCLTCLKKVHRKQNGCPICRGSIAAVVPLPTFHART